MDIVTYALCRRYADKLIEESGAAENGIFDFNVADNDGSFTVTGYDRDAMASVIGAMQGTNKKVPTAVLYMYDDSGHDDLGTLFLPLLQAGSYQDTYPVYHDELLDNTDWNAGGDFGQYSWSTQLSSAKQYHLEGEVWVDTGSGKRDRWIVDDLFTVNGTVTLDAVNYEIQISTSGIQVRMWSGTGLHWDMSLYEVVEEEQEATGHTCCFTGYSAVYGTNCVLSGDEFVGTQSWTFYTVPASGGLPNASGVSF